ncbi:99ec31df-74a8-41e5-962f-66f1e8244550 [Thermothielavioides terrestris]|uniref:Mitochondrial large ribosomal subunit n=2 Tax=Thermothielavioides terrestris TaxID=2587410 RepID=G2QWH1_THETT|nr:uncharacterized protein THITE_2073073 [Thermothielavioides terrestris NRRL 8126]AEO64746.1 hypothetical protein THITE_2073073 [Thermothielavioides terrestris NRRL 8126]SPQ26404.1 99ec31df-74a8-41e5-962f-66f1e8244550 [Thermothielavioides terrestris]
MSLSVPSRRLLRGAPALSSACPTTTTMMATTTTTRLLPALQSLSLAPTAAPSRALHTTPSNQWFWKRNKPAEESPIMDQVQGTQETRKALVKSLTSRVEGPAIFEDELKDTAAPTEPGAVGQRQPATYTRAGASLVREHLARAVDPDPRSRVRWERKMVIRQVHRGTDPYSVEPRAERIARTERKLTSKSPWLATSTKKLVKLAHQIQGKTVDDAIVQMRFSKKKMAQEVRYQLELARDLAIAERGMGLGSKSAAANGEGEGAAAAAAEGEVRQSENKKVIEIRTKDGKWVKIDDPTRMYVAEAWVNRGPWRGKLIDYRARGRTYIKQRPTASISIVLKEEKTRIREHEERVAKQLRQGPWVHLPDRPVTAQRQYYSW